MHVATQTRETMQSGSRQAAANYRPAACAPRKQEAHVSQNLSFPRGWMQKLRALQSARLEDSASAVLRRLAIPRDCAVQSDRGRIASFHREADARGFLRGQRFGPSRAPLMLA